MISPLLSVAEMAAVDAAAHDLDALIERAGRAVAREAVRLMGGAYGRRVVVLAGPGNNGADGRVAAAVLERAGVRVRVVELGEPIDGHRPDLVIDAAVGAGLSRPFTAPELPWATPVLAVDVPSGLDGDTGLVRGRVWPAERTVTFGAAKPGHLLEAGPEYCGDVVVVDIGLDLGVVSPTMFHLSAVAAGSWLVNRSRHDHKWTHGVRVIAGSPGMTGAASLTSLGALRAGAGIVVVSMVDGSTAVDLPTEVVQEPVDDVLKDLAATDRFRSVVIGPGAGDVDGAELAAAVGRRTSGVVVLDADAIRAVAAHADAVRTSAAMVVITPHDGELARLAPTGADRLSRVRDVAARFGAVVVSKGPTNVVAAPTGEVVLVDHGDQRLATAGSGDVLAGVVAAVVEATDDGVDAAHRVASAAVLHAEAARLAGTVGITASDIAEALPRARARVEGRT